MAVTRRVYLYGIALVALGMLVAGLVGLLQIVLEAVVRASQPVAAGAGGDPFRNRVSFSSALAAIGLVAWLIHWGLADRPVRQGGAASAAERSSAIRRLFLYLVLFVGGLVLAFTAQALLSDLLLALFGRLTWASVQAGSVIHPLATLGVAVPLWLYYARVARTDRRRAPEVGAGATLRRWCVYALAFVGLLMAVFAAIGLVQTLWGAFFVPAVVVVSEGLLPTVVLPRISSLAVGLALWCAAWTWSTAAFARTDDPDPESRSVLRKVYLYLVLAVAVAWTVWNLGRLLYEALRAVLIPGRLAAGWGGVLNDLGSPIALALVFGVVWAYHAYVVRREAALAGEWRRQATIRWFYGYLVALIGALTLAIGLGGALDTLLGALVQPPVSRPDHWLADRVSLYATLIAVGLPVWAAYWLPLQREASDPLAREALVRRIYLYLVFGLTVLTLLGSGAYTLYQVIRLLLGESWSASTTSDLLSAASAATVAGLFLGYHLRVFRGRGAPPETAPPAPQSWGERDAAGLAPGESEARLAPVGSAAEAAAASAAGAAGPVAAPLLALAVVRAPDAAVLAQLQRELLAHAPAGVEVQLLPVDAPTAARLAAEAGAA